jgi:predicted neutral ceramidase superfamily lipid hydrolase
MTPNIRNMVILKLLPTLKYKQRTITYIKFIVLVISHLKQNSLGVSSAKMFMALIFTISRY